MNSKLILPTSNNRGMALVATLVLVLVITSFAIALLSLTSSDIKLSSLQKTSKETFYIAEAGLERAIAWLEKEGNPQILDLTNPFSEENGGYPIVGNGKYKVELQATSPLSYIIQSEGIKSLNADKEVKVKIESKVMLENFAMFAYFSDKEIFPIDIYSGYGSNQEIWFYGDDHIEGRLHSNDRLNMAGNPTFDGLVTSSYKGNNGDVSWKPYPGISTNPVFNGGYTGGVGIIPLPDYRGISDLEDKKSLQVVAAGSKSFINNHANKGTYVPNDGGKVTDGIWVKGDVKEIILGKDPNSGNSKIIIDQSNLSSNKITTIYIIEEDSPITIGKETYTEGTLVYDKVTNTYEHFPGKYNKPNGVIFVNGEVKGLRTPSATESGITGGVKGRYTIASDYDINITGNILYNTRVEEGEESFIVDEGYPDIPDSLGLVSEKNIKIAKQAPTDIEINAILMALGTSFYYEGWKDVTKGTLKVYGSFIQNQRGPVGTFSTSGSSIKKTGYTKDYHYDKRMSSNNPDFGNVLPPYFPTTGKYIKLWWREM